jgi:hypothetical protein
MRHACCTVVSARGYPSCHNVEVTMDSSICLYLPAPIPRLQSQSYLTTGGLQHISLSWRQDVWGSKFVFTSQNCCIPTALSVDFVLRNTSPKLQGLYTIKECRCNNRAVGTAGCVLPFRKLGDTEKYAVRIKAHVSIKREDNLYTCHLQAKINPTNSLNVTHCSIIFLLSSYKRLVWCYSYFWLKCFMSVLDWLVFW